MKIKFKSNFNNFFLAFISKKLYNITGLLVFVLTVRLFVLLFIALSSFFNPAFSAGDDKLSTKSFETYYLDESCSLTGKLASKYVRPMSARVVECIDGTMSSLFLGTNPATGFTLFQEFQVVLKPMIILILVLYLTVNGYLILTGQMLKEKPTQEIIMFILKFILVFYFSVGDAWKDFFFVAIRSISFTFSTILIEAGASTLQDGCIFTGPGASAYPAGKGYIALFDTLDCKFGNYMGWFVGKKFPLLIPIGITSFFLLGVGAFITSLVFTVTLQIIVLAARIAQLYLVSIMVLTILIYASPIIIPLVLFKSTKQIFDNWLGQIIGLVIHPIMVFAMTGILLCVTDRIYYGSDPDGEQLFLAPKFQAQYKEMNNAATIEINVAKLLEDNKRNPNAINLISGFEKIISLQKEEVEKYAKEINGVLVFIEHQGSQIPSHYKCPEKKSECGTLNLGHQNLLKLQDTLDKVKQSENNGVKDITLETMIMEALETVGLFLIKGFGELHIGSGKGMFNDLAGTFIPAIKGLETVLHNPNAREGARVNPDCYGGVLYSKGLDFIAGMPSLVCVIKWFDQSFPTVALPIPYFIEIVDVYIPLSLRIDIFALFLVMLIICGVLNFLAGTIFEKMEGVMEQISGVSVRQMGSYMKMADATQTGMNSYSAIKGQQDKAFKRDSNAGKGKDGDKGENNKNIASGKEGGENNKNIASGKEGGEGGESGGGGAGGGGAGVADAASAGAGAG